MRQMKCPNCGAPVPVPRAGATVTCNFCGGEFLAGIPASAGESKPRVRFSILGSALPLVLGIAVAVMLLMNGPTRPSGVGPVLNQRVTTKKAGGVPPSELSRASGDLAWFDIDGAEPDWSWTALDPVDGIRWCLALARKWSTDARLDLAFVRGVEPDGTVDV